MHREFFHHPSMRNERKNQMQTDSPSLPTLSARFPLSLPASAKPARKGQRTKVNPLSSVRMGQKNITKNIHSQAYNHAQNITFHSTDSSINLLQVSSINKNYFSSFFCVFLTLRVRQRGSRQRRQPGVHWQRPRQRLPPSAAFRDSQGKKEGIDFYFNGSSSLKKLYISLLASPHKKLAGWKMHFFCRIAENFCL